MAFVQKDFIWEKVYPANYDTVQADTVLGRYTIEKCLGADCVNDDTYEEYKWGYSLNNGKSGYFTENTYEDAVARVQKHFQQEMTYSFDVITTYGAPYTVNLDATGISGAIENDTIEVVIGAITYTFTADATGAFDGTDFTVTGGDADANLSFAIDQTEETITIINSVETFTVTSYTLTLSGTPTEDTTDVEATATEY